MATEQVEEKQKRTIKKRLSQTDVPAHTVMEALRIPNALRDNFAKSPTRPLNVAHAMNMQPTSGSFRMLTGAAVAYGLTTGAAQGGEIGLAPLGLRAVAPTAEGDDMAALREAVLKPRVVREFLQRYDGNRIPADHIALNVLEEMGVPNDARERALAIIVRNAEDLGLIKTISEHKYVDLGAPAPEASPATDAIWEDEAEGEAEVAQAQAHDGGRPSDPGSAAGAAAGPAPAINDITVNRRVFVTHGKATAVVEQLKEVLKFGGFTPVVSVERQSVAKPVPDKVMDDMRSCGAGIVHVGIEQTLLDAEGNEVKVLNPNVLIEIGAALALYGRNFILLVEQGTQLPSNLQGLYEVRYDGGKLDYEATMKLLKAFNDFKGAAEG